MMGWPIQYALQASVPLATGLALAAAFKRRSAAVRHSVLASSIVAALAIPVLWIVVPSWHVFPANPPRAVAPAPSRAAAGVTTTEIVEVDGPAAAVHGRTSDRSAESVVVWAWSLGALAVALFVLGGLGRLRWLASRARAVDDGPWRALLADACDAAGVPNSVQVLQSDHRWMLATWGSRRPTLFLPADAQTWPVDRIRIVLLHELAHVARRDWRWQLAAEALRSALWFNPLVWLVARQLRIESEHACDDVVLDSGVAADHFAGELVALARTLQQPRLTVLAAPAMARPSSLEGRVSAMLNTALDRRPASRFTSGVIAALLFAVVLPVAAIRAQTFYTFAGRVSDSTDRPIPNATLTLKNEATGQLSQIQSDAQGSYQFVGLPSAAYTLDVKMIGFETLHVSDLAINSDLQRDLRLAVGSLQESVTVSGANANRPPQPAPMSGGLTAMERLQKAQAACQAHATSLGGNILAPVKLVDVHPVYPASEQSSGMGGIVTMDATIGADGFVSSVENLAGGDVSLQNAAADAVRQWQYSQTLLNCQPIPVHMNVTVNFKAAQ